jgi:hypothetical protein
MAAVLTLQALHDYSDQETAEAVRLDVRWKAAIGAPLDDPGFDLSTLVYWRRRLAGPVRPQRVSAAVKKAVEQTGCWGGGGRWTPPSWPTSGPAAARQRELVLQPAPPRNPDRPVRRHRRPWVPAGHPGTAMTRSRLAPPGGWPPNKMAAALRSIGALVMTGGSRCAVSDARTHARMFRDAAIA